MHPVLLCGSCDHDHAPFKGIFVILMLGLDIDYLSTKCDHFSFRRYRDMVGSPI